jgi:N-acetylglucosamine-6-phosphate deacetylase
MTPEPQYYDLQVNGYAGVDFNQDALSADDLHTACLRLRADGVAGALATIITDELPLMAGRLKRLAELRRADPLVAEVIRGIHLEGPFISDAAGFHGAHSPQAIRPPDLSEAGRLLDAAEGLIRLVTLAPERDQGLKLTRHLAARGIVVSAGHCDPSLDELKAAIDAGLSMFTHLGNGCPGVLPRHDNIIQRVLSIADRLTIMFIADGVHIPPPALGNYLRLAGPQRTICTTDAIAAAGCGPGRYRVGSRTIDIGPDMVARCNEGTSLCGSTVTMPAMAALLRDELKLPLDAIQRLLSENPHRVLQRLDLA